MARSQEAQHNLLQLRHVMESVDPHRLHMQAVEETTSCGTAACLLGWAMSDVRLKSQLDRHSARGDIRTMSFYGMLTAAETVFGLEPEDGKRLFAEGISGSTDPHAIAKEEVMDNLDRVIRGEPALPYLVVVQQHHHDGDRLQDYDGPCAGGLSYVEAEDPYYDEDKYAD